MPSLQNILPNFISLLRQRKIDPRIFQIMAVGTYAVLAREISAFERPHEWMLLIVLWGVLLDLALGKFYFKKINFPFTPIIAGIATSLLMDSPHLWVYLAAVSFAILSKAFIAYRGRHLLNPANAGVVFSLLAFPGMVTGIPKLFNVDVSLIAVFCVVGLFVATYARVLQVALLWIASFAAFSFYRHWFGGTPLELAFLPMLAPTFFLYSFHMITDPATTPRTFGGRFVFVFAVAAIDAFVRMRFIPFSNLYALVAVSLFFHALNSFRQHDVASAWQFARKSSLWWALPLFAVLVSYRLHRENESYQNDPALHIKNPASVAEQNSSAEPSTAPMIIFQQAQGELGLKFSAIDPDVDKKLANKLRIQWVGPGITVRDFNGDGWMDLFLVNSNHSKSKSALFINQNGQGFRDEAPKWGLDRIPADLIPQAATPFDYNNDGREDLLITGPGCMHLYENQGGKFVDATEKAGLKDCSNSIVALPLDFNHDGWMDLFVGRFFSENIDLKNVRDMYYFGPDSFGQATNGGLGTLFRNDGGVFKAAPEVFTQPSRGWTWDLGLADVMDTARPVLVIGNDFGNDFYVETGAEKFTDLTEKIAQHEDRSSMTVSFGHWNNQYPQIFLTNVYIYDHKVRGNFLWQFEPRKNKLLDYQNERKTDHCGWPWGSAFADFDLNGQTDLYVANGMITRSDKISDRSRDANFFKLMTTGPIPGDAWRKGSTSVFEFIDDQKDFAGFQRDCLYMKYPNATAYENKSLDNPDIDFWDGRAVALIDYDNNGVLDIMVSTQGSEYRFLKNLTPPADNWIGFELLADPTKTMGARIKITQGREVRYHWYQNGKTGFLAFSDPRIHFGLSDGQQPVQIEIRWADGSLSELSDLQPGRYHKLKLASGNKLTQQP